MFLYKNTVLFYCVIISHGTNIHNISCTVELVVSDDAMIFPISLIAFVKMRRKVMFLNKY